MTRNLWVQARRIIIFVSTWCIQLDFEDHYESIKIFYHMNIIFRNLTSKISSASGCSTSISLTMKRVTLSFVGFCLWWRMVLTHFQTLSTVCGSASRYLNSSSGMASMKGNRRWNKSRNLRIFMTLLVFPLWWYEDSSMKCLVDHLCWGGFRTYDYDTYEHAKKQLMAKPLSSSEYV